MLGPKNYPTPLQQVNHDADLGKHHRKLEEIHKSNKNREFMDQRIADKEKLFEAREKGLKFHNSERLIAIEKDNELLLGKLVEIARKKKTAADFKAEKHNIGTLNAPSRKREKDRIAAENEAFARRLLSQQPSFNRKKLETDYEKHNSRVKQMQKVPFYSPSRKTKLPPLKEEEIRQSKSSHNLKAKSIHSKSQPKSVKNIDSNNEVNPENERIAKEQAELKAQQEKEELERVERELKEAREAREAKEAQEAREAQEAKEAQERKEAQEKAEKDQREKEEQDRKEKERIEAEESQKQQEKQQEQKPEDNSPQEKASEKSVADIQKSQNEIKNESVEEKKSADKPQEHKEEVTGMAETKKPE